jgi:hypothetical protein
MSPSPAEIVQQIGPDFKVLLPAEYQ